MASFSSVFLQRAFLYLLESLGARFRWDASLPKTFSLSSLRLDCTKYRNAIFRGNTNSSQICAGKQARVAADDASKNPEAPPTGQAAKIIHHHAVSDPAVVNAKSKRIDESKIAKLVAEENESKSKFPKYPALERWQLLEKMGDGAFSNVYRAKDRHEIHGEVAIKVVRKYEMNSLQVSFQPEVPTYRYNHSIGTVSQVSFSSCPRKIEWKKASSSFPTVPPLIPFYFISVLPTRRVSSME